MTNYFSHDSNARNSDKLIRLRMRHKAAGYGVYFMILERLREEEGYMSVKDYNMIAFDLREDASLIKSVVEDFGLFVFTEDGEYFYSEGFNARMEKMETTSKKRSDAGKEGAKKRWGKKKALISDNQIIITEENSKTIANAIETDSKTIANATKSDSNKNKRKENKEISPDGDTKKAPEGLSLPESPKTARKRFEKPTIEEITAYCKERGNGIDALGFFDYYESKGWVIGKSPMKDWKAAVRNWERMDNYMPRKGPPKGNPPREPTRPQKIIRSIDDL